MDIKKLISIISASLMIVVGMACSSAPDPTATNVPPTATAVPVATEIPDTWVGNLMRSPGYQPEWGEPKAGGILKYAFGHSFNGHDPVYGHSFEGVQFMPTYNALLRIDPWVGHSAVQPDLAESWEFSSDQGQLTFKLRQGVKFQDNPNLPAEVTGVSGDEFTCEDAKASIEWGKNPPEEIKTRHTRYQGQVTHVSEISCPDGPLGYTLVLKFDPILAKTLATFAGGGGMPNNMDKDFIDWLRSDCQACMNDTDEITYLYGTGTGAFVPTEFQSDVLTKIRRNPTYFRDGLPLLDGMDQYTMKDFTSRFTALATGQIHYFGEGTASLLPGQVEQVQRDFADKIVIDPTLHSWGSGLTLNTGRPPFDNTKVRQAMHLMLDREEWRVFNESGTLQATELMAMMVPGTYWAPSDLETWPGLRQPKDEDVAAANKLLDEVYGEGVRPDIRCMASSSEISSRGCLFFKDQAKKQVNMDITLDLGEGAVFAERRNRGDYEMRFGWPANTNVGDPDDWFYQKVVVDTAYSSYKMALEGVSDTQAHKDIEAAIWAQSEVLDPVTRRDMVREIERELTTESAYFLMFGWDRIMPAWRSEFKGWNMFEFPSQAKWTGWERAWLAQ
jgi:peptide/nickel transport system substrate-binding protein